MRAFKKQDGKTLENELEVVEGMKFDRGYISPYFVTNPKTQKCELENPYVLVFEKKISGLTSLLPVLEAELKTQRPLLIVAEAAPSPRVRVARVLFGVRLADLLRVRRDVPVRVGTYGQLGVDVDETNAVVRLLPGSLAEADGLLGGRLRFL